MRKLGDFGPEIAPIVFGAWQAGGWWWGGADDDQQVRAMHAAFDAGINAVDTAPAYGRGHSEEVVGRAIRGRKGVVVMTKCGLHWDTDQGVPFFETADPDGTKWSMRRWAAPGAVERECEASLRRLGVDAIDLYQLHWPEPDRLPEETIGAMERLRQQGKIKAIGVSNCPPDWLARARRVAPLTSIQPKWSWWTRGEERTSIAWARQNGVGAIVYSPLEQGLLTGKIRPGHAFAKGDFRAAGSNFKPEVVERANAALDDVRGMAAAKGCTLGQLILAATIAEPGITGAIVGARNAEQAVQNARAMDVVVTDDERRTIRGVFERAKPDKS